MMLSIGRLKVGASELLGLTRFRWSRRAAGLYVFTFHRIGEAREGAFDPNVFSCGVEDFARTIEFLRREFDVIGLDELDSCVEEASERRRVALITFDDGYIDNYEIAMPMLKDRGLSATFFVATSMADGDTPWWDTLAWWVRHAQVDQARLNGVTVDLKSDRVRCIKPILKAFKEDSGTLAEKLDRYRATLRPEVDAPDQRLIMNWEQLREAVRNGFAVGSHTVNHPILSHLSEEEQMTELTESKTIIEHRLGSPISAVAFPVGGESAYTRETIRLAREAGYDYAFTSVGGMNRWGELVSGRLNRIVIDSGDLAELRYRITGFF